MRAYVNELALAEACLCLVVCNGSGTATVTGAAPEDAISPPSGAAFPLAENLSLGYTVQGRH